MASRGLALEYIKTAVARGRTYDELGENHRSLVTPSDWKARCGAMPRSVRAGPWVPPLLTPSAFSPQGQTGLHRGWPALGRQPHAGRRVPRAGVL
jgi:hypothetical protein